MTLYEPPYVDNLGPVRRVLSKTVIRAADRLALTTAELARIIGLSPASVSSLKAGDYALNSSTKSWELAVLFVDLFRYLEAITGGDDESARAWRPPPQCTGSAHPERTGIGRNRQLCGG